MNSRPAQAKRQQPKFDNPPITEVVVCAYFKSLPNFLTAHYGKLWKLVEADYPKTQDREPLIVGPLNVFSELPPPLRRVFLTSENDTYVMQLQPDFFAHNWRKVRDADKYPSFDVPRELFLSRWKQFNDFVREVNAGDIVPKRYEITYVNQFFEPKGAFPLAIHKYSPVITLGASQKGVFLSSPQALSAVLHFDLPEKLGQLEVSFKQGERRSDQTEVMQLQITARKDDLGVEGLSDLAAWLEKAHECIASSFVELTTPEAHRIWGRTQ